jgi:hypothetical protein
MALLSWAMQSPRQPEIVQLLEDAAQNAVVNLLGIDIADRPCFLSELLPALSRLRVETARPHWLVIDDPCRHAGPAAGGLVVA